MRFGVIATYIKMIDAIKHELVEPVNNTGSPFVR